MSVEVMRILFGQGKTGNKNPPKRVLCREQAAGP